MLFQALSYRHQTFEKWWHGRFLEIFEIPLDFPHKEPPKTFLKYLCCLAPAIYLIWVHLHPPHTKCHTGISMEFRKISSRQRGKRGDGGFFLFPCFWQCSPDRLPAKNSNGLKKFFLHGQQIWCHQWFIMLSGLQYVYIKFSYFGWKEEDSENSL